jgi:hypothetical protein
MQLAEAITVPDAIEEASGGLIAMDDVESTIVRDGIDYWNSLCRGRPFPSRADITPREMRKLLRNTCLIRVVNDGADYDYRVNGDAHVIAYGFSMQGKLLSETDAYAPGHAEVLKRLYDRVVRRRQPYALRGWIARSEKQKKFIYSESLFAPLGEGDTVDHVFNVSVYVPRDL